MNSYPGAFFDMHEVVMCEQLLLFKISSAGNWFLEEIRDVLSLIDPLLISIDSILSILCHVQVIHLLFNRAEAKDSIHELNAAEQMKENMKLKDQIMAKDVEISLLKESLIENGNHTICNDHTNGHWWRQFRF